MSIMIERVKEAIAKCYAPAINHNAPYAKVMLDMAAKAVINAMREPTDAQRNKYYELSNKTETFVDAHWERAIDAILEEKE